MLQFIAEENDRYTIPEAVQMVIEGGCVWVQLHVPGMDDGAIRELVRELEPLCREAGTILTIEDHAELALETRIHGVHLTRDIHKAPHWREVFGPEAIIGVQTSDPAEVLPIARADIDYVAFDPMPVDQLQAKVAILRDADVELPVVATGDLTEADIPKVLAAGCNGVALSSVIIDAPDPVEATAHLLNRIQDSGFRI